MATRMNNTWWIRGGTVCTPDGMQQADLLVDNGRITAVGEGLTAPGAQEVDATGLLVMPGFIDIHTHGAVGVDMNGADKEGLAKVSAFFASQGVTGFLPTLLTDSHEALLQYVHTIGMAAPEITDGAAVLGIHLEGPYLCAEYKGAMPEHLLQTPDFSKFMQYQKASGGRIRRMTVSPEVEGVAHFIPKAVAEGVSVSIGHSGADYDTAWAAIRSGAACATHTFNAMKLLHQHFPAISGAVLESDIYAEAICDGIHLHPGTVRILLKAKGLDRVIAITDSIMAAGLGDGRFKLGVNDVIVKDGDATLADGGSRAGSTLTMSRAFANLRRFTGLPAFELAKLLSANPADLLGMGDRKGRILPGYDADLTLVTDEGAVAATFVEGRRVYTAG